MLKISKITDSLKAEKKRKRNVDLEFVLTFYDCWIREKSIQKTARAMEIPYKRLEKLILNYPELQIAKNMADDRRVNHDSLGEYALRFLSPEARVTWDRITDLTTWEQIEDVFSRKGGESLRKQLFCFAMLKYGFNQSRACAAVALRFKKLCEWKHDPEFGEMLEEIQYHKKNFMENGFLELVEERYPGAVLMANRTLNADRGYREKLEVMNTDTENVSGEFEVQDLMEFLDFETQKKLLGAMDKLKRKREDAQRHPEAKQMKRVRDRE
jgi:hypothetical protein